MKNQEIHSWEEADRAMEALAKVSITRRATQAEIDAEIASVHETYRGRLSRLEEEIESLEAALAKFAKKRKSEFKPDSEGGRSHEHAGVVLGFRLTPPAVRIENEPRAIDFLSRFEGGVYLRVKAEPDRQALAEALKDDSSPIVEKLAAHGITLQQKDKFFIEVKEVR
ncbi:MAG TPA: host-nuclease inhibitor Gam family protein [Terriglobia bacterium]|jgi:phage host-nuclease inhibitor protein Gam|nr:host-nuclease inhibitor Gam family protein [Terracidiphilus sp.]HZT69543.1 host-nuclease inhibitor Gam family protein [Terriglobia bacterium]